MNSPACANCYHWTGRHGFWKRLLRKWLRTGKCLSACSSRSGQFLWWYETCAWHVNAITKH